MKDKTHFLTLKPGNNTHYINPYLVKKYGMIESVILEYIIKEIIIRKNFNSSYINGKTWVMHTLDDFHHHLPYISKYRISNILYKFCNGKKRKSNNEILEFEPILLKDKFNKHPFDSTLWYALIDENKWLSEYT